MVNRSKAVRRGARSVVFAPIAAGGVFFGTVLFCLSLTPSMVPRSPLMQGALGGILFSLGYWLWVMLCWLLDWLGLPPTTGWILRYSRAGLLALSALAAGIGISFSDRWQNSIRIAWNLPEAAAAAPVTVALITAITFAVFFLLGRAFRILAHRWSTRSARILPARLAKLIGILVAAAIFATIVEGVALRLTLRAISQASMVADALVQRDIAPPTEVAKTGSAASLVSWQDLGRWGRQYVTSGPTNNDIAAFWRGPASEPIRVYVGLNAAANAKQRAQLAFDELIRVGGFGRSTLVIAVPTGSGWLDPGAVDTLEYIARGDVATVAVQYSYLSSPVSVIVDINHGIEEAQELFDLVYRRWTTLPKDQRPRLYLHGLSLGAFLSQDTVPLLDVLADPFQGALWVGSPYLSDFWQRVVAGRRPDSPAWRPRFGNGSLIRSLNQSGGLETYDADWGPMRLVLLQYGSDPIVYFDWALAFRRPHWLGDPRAPDISPQMRWVPLVTLFQVGVEMAVALGTPGFGHDYVARHYVPAWAAVLAPPGWDAQTEARLIRHIEGLAPR